MARTAPGVVPKLILPNPPEKYSREDQVALRRILQEAGSVPPDFSTLITVPPPVTALGTLTGAADTVPYFTSPKAMAVTAFTAYIRSLTAAASATAARVTLDIVEHQSSQIITTGSLAVSASESGDLTLPDLAADLIAIEVDRSCWIQLYSTSAARTADSARTLPTRPTAGTGVLAEFVLSAAGTTPGSPPPRLINGDGTGGAALNKKVYYRITNTSAAPHTVQVTFHFGALP